VYVWNYNTNFSCYNAPCPNIDVIGPNVRFLAAHGVNGVFMQAPGDAQNSELCELRNYLISRMLWDPTLDDRKVIDEFLTLYYGRAASAIRDYLSLIGQTARGAGIHQHCFGSAASYGIDSKVAHRALGLLEKGMAVAESDEAKHRVEKVTIGPRTVLIDPFARWVRNHHRQISSGNQIKVPPDVLSGISSELREVFRLYERHGVDLFSEGLSIATVKSTLPADLLSGK
jgi:hypothetical protein